MKKNKEFKILLISILAVVAMLIVTWKICPLCIHNNDDKILMYLTAGYATGTPEMASAFGSAYWYGLISLFYRFNPAVAWYSIFQLAALAASLVAICYCIIQSDSFKGVLLGLAAFIAIYFGCIIFFASAIQYTATVGIVGGASVCLMVVGCKKDYFVNAEIIASMVFFVVAYGLRRQFGIVTLSALLIVLFFNVFHLEFRQSMARIVILLMVFMFSYIANYSYELYSDMDDFNSYYSAAGAWNDYPHLSYEGNEDVYKKVGWDETLYNAASDWFFMDKNVNEVSFLYLNNHYKDDSSIVQKLDRAKNMLLSNGLANGQVIIWILMFAIFNLIAFIKKYSWQNVLCADALAGLFALLIVYFLIKGRLPLRAYQSLIYIYGMPFVVLFIEQLLSLKKKDGRVIVIATLVLCGLVLYSRNPEMNMVKAAIATCNDPGRINDQKQFESLDRYAMSNPDNLYIYDSDLANPVGIFTTYVDEKPTNLMQWGGWQYNMPTYWKQLEKNGFETMEIKYFFDKRVYFCSRNDMEVLQAYVKARVPKASLELVDNVDGVNIYQFTR